MLKWFGRFHVAYRLLGVMVLIFVLLIWKELEDLDAQITKANQIAEGQARCAIYIEQWLHQQVSPQIRQADKLSEVLTMRSIEQSKECLGRKGFF